MSLAGEPGMIGGMEILMILGQVEPPAGHLRVMPGPSTPASAEHTEVGFTGWLGLMRALSEVLGSPAERSPERA
jgi:hypothetical protein